MANSYTLVASNGSTFSGFLSMKEALNDLNQTEIDHACRITAIQTDDKSVIGQEFWSVKLSGDENVVWCNIHNNNEDVEAEYNILEQAHSLYGVYYDIEVVQINVQYVPTPKKIPSLDRIIVVAAKYINDPIMLITTYEGIKILLAKPRTTIVEIANVIAIQAEDFSVISDATEDLLKEV